MSRISKVVCIALVVVALSASVAFAGGKAGTYPRRAVLTVAKSADGSLTASWPPASRATAYNIIVARYSLALGWSAIMGTQYALADLTTVTRSSCSVTIPNAAPPLSSALQPGDVYRIEAIPVVGSTVYVQYDLLSSEYTY